MKKTTEEKTEEIIKEVGNTFRQVAGTFLPVIAIADNLSNFRSRLKQQRLMDFAESLRKVFEEELEINLHNYNFETEDFIDVLDSTLSKVHATKSEQKILHFRNILANYVTRPIDNSLVNKYLDILNEINEVQLVILEKLPHKIDKNTTGVDFMSIVCYMSGLKGQELIDTEFKYKKFDFQLGNQKMEITLHDLDFYVNDLVSKGLIIKSQKKTTIQNEMGSMQIPEPIHLYSVSKTAGNFIQFITRYKKE
jgi:hypothetical protein